MQHVIWDATTGTRWRNSLNKYLPNGVFVQDLSTHDGSARHAAASCRPGDHYELKNALRAAGQHSLNEIMAAGRWPRTMLEGGGPMSPSAGLCVFR